MMKNSTDCLITQQETGSIIQAACLLTGCSKNKNHLISSKYKKISDTGAVPKNMAHILY
jgi:hypothetical protein